MDKEKISKSEMVSRMDMTSAAFDAFMTCGGDVVPLVPLIRAAKIVQHDVKLELVRGEI